MKLNHVLMLTGMLATLLAIALPHGLTAKRNGALELKTNVAYAAFTGTVSISPKPVIAGQPITLTVTDADLATITTTTTVSVFNPTTTQSVIVTLLVTDSINGTFVGSLLTTNAAGPGTAVNLNVQSGQTIQVTYLDALNASGGQNVQVTDSALVTAPAIPTPSQVTGLNSTFVNSSSVRLGWTKSTSTGVTGYKVYFGTSSGNYTGTSKAGASPIKTFGNMTTLSQLPTPTIPAALPAVTNVALSPFSQGLVVTWSPVTGATGYKIYYSTSSFDSSTLPTNPVTINGTGTTYTLSGLTNGTQYFVAVTAIAQPRYYFAVTAAIDPSLSTSTPGSANESNFSAEVSLDMSSTKLESTIATPRSAFPEVIAAYPNLKNEGCFIATAAYGFYSAPQVQVLRDFRDRYLLTNAPGRAFVAWYYRYGPSGAHYLNQHPGFKPLVRLALLPLVAVALFLISTPMAVKLAVVLSAIFVSLFLMRRKMLLCSGGVQ